MEIDVNTGGIRDTVNQTRNEEEGEKEENKIVENETIVINDLLDSIIDELEEINKIILRREAAEKFEILEKKLDEGIGGNSTSNDGQINPTADTSNNSNDYYDNDGVARIVNSANTVNTIPVVSSSKVKHGKITYKPIRSYRTLRASEVFLPSSATESERLENKSIVNTNLHVEFYSLEELKDLFRIRGNLKDNCIEIDEIIDENGDLPDGIKVGDELLAIGNVRAYPSMTDRFSRMLLSKTKYDDYDEEVILNPHQVLVQIGHRVKREHFEKWYLDSRKQGNISRFIRYIDSNDTDSSNDYEGMETNAAIDVVYVKDSCPRIFLVATQRIDIGEEIVFKF